MGVGIPIGFKKRQPLRDRSGAVLAPDQQRRVIEYGFGKPGQPTPPARRSGGTTGVPAWIDRALDALEPSAD